MCQENTFFVAYSKKMKGGCVVSPSVLRPARPSDARTRPVFGISLCLRPDWARAGGKAALLGEARASMRRGAGRLTGWLAGGLGWLAAGWLAGWLAS